MLKRTLFAMTLSAATAAPALAVGITGTKDSADFAYKYEADVLPDAAGLGFTLQDSANIFADSVTLSSGVLTINTDTNATANDIIYYQMNGGNWSPSFLGDFTLEIRANVRPNNNGTYGAAVGMSDVNSAGFFQMFHNKVNMEGVDIATDPNNDGFHVFRVVSISDGSSAGQTFRVYRDGVQVGSDVGQITNFTGDLLRFGDFISGSAEANFDIDYIRWDTSGAWTPVIPEPATLSLAACAGLALVARRRR